MLYSPKLFPLCKINFIFETLIKCCQTIFQISFNLGGLFTPYRLFIIHILTQNLPPQTSPNKVSHHREQALTTLNYKTLWVSLTRIWIPHTLVLFDKYMWHLKPLIKWCCMSIYLVKSLNFCVNIALWFHHVNFVKFNKFFYSFCSFVSLKEIWKLKDQIMTSTCKFGSKACL